MSSERDAVFDKLLAEYEREFTAFSTKLKRALSVLIKSGPQSKEEVIKFMAGSGLTDVANNFVAKYSEAIDNAARISAQTGINLVLPERSLSILALIEENQVSNILGASDAIAKTVADASLRYGIGESKLNTIIAELEASITTAGRRIVSEAVTGASIYDRTIKFEQFTNAGVEKYFYEGPLDNVTRDSCAATLGDSRQSTGWTMADIQSSQTPFITCGGYNCRHEWLPFVEGLDDLIKDMQAQAGII